MFTCPHCGQPGISALRKLALGPALPATCRSCGKKVGVPYWSVLTTLPFIAGIILTLLRTYDCLGIVIMVTGFIVGVVIDMVWVPLQRR
jgi:prepilin signal peptidase PulO-like enzyme (type II secretory pathway)